MEYDQLPWVRPRPTSWKEITNLKCQRCNRTLYGNDQETVAYCWHCQRPGRPGYLPDSTFEGMQLWRLRCRQCGGTDLTPSTSFWRKPIFRCSGCSAEMTFPLPELTLPSLVPGDNNPDNRRDATEPTQKIWRLHMQFAPCQRCAQKEDNLTRHYFLFLADNLTGMHPNLTLAHGVGCIGCMPPPWAPKDILWDGCGYLTRCRICRGLLAVNQFEEVGYCWKPDCWPYEQDRTHDDFRDPRRCLQCGTAHFIFEEEGIGVRCTDERTNEGHLNTSFLLPSVGRRRSEKNYPVKSSDSGWHSCSQCGARPRG